MFEIFRNRLEITGTLTTITALKISEGRSLDPIDSDLPVIKDGLGYPFIPGASFKGAMRSRLESFLRAINPTLAANPANEEEWSITANDIKELKKKYQENDEQLTQEIIKNTDFISLLFGSSWLASKLQIRDLTVVKDTWFGQYQERNGVAIERETETAADGKLYDYQVVPAGVEFDCKMIVENAEEWELGLLMIGLHQFETEQIPLGGGRSRGLGVVRLDVEQMRWFDYPEDQPQLLLDYLEKLVMDDETAYEDAHDYKDHWVKQLIQYLKTNIEPHLVKISETK